MARAISAASALLLCLAALVPAQAVQVDGSGTTNPSKFFWKIMEMFRTSSRNDLRITYRAVGSGTGQKEFSQNAPGVFSAPLTDFGAGDIPMSQTLYNSITTTGGRSMVHVPFSLGAIAIFHSVPAAEVGNDGLKLSPCVLAKIFSGQITTWDHADIKADNPNLAVPAGETIKVGHRTLGSSSTGGITGYLANKTQADNCASSWTIGGASIGSGSTVTWPTSGGFTAVEGSGGMKSHIASVPYAIGYLDAGHGHERNFAEAMLRNQDGNWLTSKQAMAAGDGGATNGIAMAGANAGNLPQPDEDWSSVNLYSKAGSTTWPIVLVSYIYLPKNWSAMAADKAGLLKAFVDYVTSPKGQKLVSDFSFNAIPAAMNFWASTTFPSITLPSGGIVPFTFETSTLPWEGQGSNVISVKRESYSMWAVDEMSAQLQSVTDRVVALETELNDYGIVPLHGSGTTNPKTLFSKALKMMEHQARVPMLMTYRAVGSSTGQKEFVGQASNGWRSYNHFGAGDIPMSQSRYNSLPSGFEMVHLPFALGAIGIFHHVPADNLGGAPLSLSACLLARIFSGDITTWDDAAIRAENPGLTVPANELIRVGHRTLGSSSTGGVAGYLNKKCPASWNLGTGSTLAWPTTAGFNAVQGSPGMKTFIQSTDYSIGYLDAGHGHGLGLSEVALTNAMGQTRTSREALALGGVADAGAEGVLSSEFPASATADWSDVDLYDMPGRNTWPIVLVSYLYVKKDQTATNSRTAAALQAFIDMILSNRGEILEEFGFTAPPPSLKSQTQAAAATIVYPSGMVSFAWETDTNPYIGMGENIISTKRHAFDDYERDLLRADILAVQTRLDALTTAPAPAPAAEGGGGDAGLIIGIIALVISLVAVALGAVAVMRKPQSTTGTGLIPSTIGNGNAA